MLFVSKETSVNPATYAGTSHHRNQIVKTATRISLTRSCMQQNVGDSCQDSSPSTNILMIGEKPLQRYH